MPLADLSDAEWLKRCRALPPTDSATSTEQDALADEIERRGLDV